MKFNYVVVDVDGCEDKAYFVNKTDAEQFARVNEVVSCVVVEMAFEDTSIPRRDLMGNQAMTETECIGVW